MQGKVERKISVVSGKASSTKKPNLEIKVPHEHENVVRTMPGGFSTFAREEQSSSQYHPISHVTSPTHMKNIPIISEIPEHLQTPKKKQEIVIHKRGSGKEIQSPKPELQTRMSANLITSPKVNSGKERIMISYGSEKNLNSIKPMEKKQGPHSRASKVEEFQRLLNDQKAKSSMLQSRQSLLVRLMDDLKKQNNSLKEDNIELKKKVEKFRISNQQTKKMLRERIHSFNEEGGELQTLRQQIDTLEERVTSLLTENQSLKQEILKHEGQNLSLIHEVRGQIATSTVREVVPLSGSRVSGLYLRDSEDGDLKVFDGMENMEQNLDLQSYITEKEESYMIQYKENEDVFNKVRIQYEQILTAIQLRYKNLAEDYEETISTQAGEIYELQLKNDELRTTEKSSDFRVNLSMQLDETILKSQGEIARLNLALYELKVSNKELIEQVEHKRAECKFLDAELNLSDLKKKFKDENGKFEGNVVKLNLLNIIDKLKIQIDRQKQKNQKLPKRDSLEA